MLMPMINYWHIRKVSNLIVFTYIEFHIYIAIEFVKVCYDMKKQDFAPTTIALSLCKEEVNCQ